MPDIIKPENIVPVYLCTICGETGYSKDGREDWGLNNPEEPWLRHDPKVMPIHGLDLKAGELFGYKRGYKEESTDIELMVFLFLLMSL